jgi:hypothetical protein
MKYQKQWEVPSDSSEKTYKVSLTMTDQYKCSCPNWIFRCQKTGDDCKHIADVKNGLYDQIPVQEFNLVIANIREVELRDDRTTVMTPMYPVGDTDFLATIVYDCLRLGVPFKQLKEHYRLHRSWSRDAIESHVQRNGRKTYGEWVEERGFVGFTKEAIND